jgi:hypothetical protein
VRHKPAPWPKLKGSSIKVNSDSTNAITDVATDLEEFQNTMRILNGLTKEQACGWSAANNEETVGLMVERIVILAGTMRQKIEEFGEVVGRAYEIGFDSKSAVTV